MPLANLLTTRMSKILACSNLHILCSLIVSLAAINSRMAADSSASLAPNLISGDIRISFERIDQNGTVIVW